MREEGLPTRGDQAKQKSRGGQAGLGPAWAWRLRGQGCWGALAGGTGDWEAWPGAQLLCISRWRREKCQLILDCKHILVPTPLIEFLWQPTPPPIPFPCPTPARHPLSVIKAIKKRCKAPGIPAWARERLKLQGEGSAGLDLDPSSDIAVHVALGRGLTLSLPVSSSVR